MDSGFPNRKILQDSIKAVEEKLDIATDIALSINAKVAETFRGRVEIKMADLLEIAWMVELEYRDREKFSHRNIRDYQ